MVRLFRRSIAIGLWVAAAGCVTVIAAPGSNQVRLTQNPADVAGCTAVGNIKTDQGLEAIASFRNSVVGFGGNTGLITQSASDAVEGIAYRCPADGKPVAK